MSDSSVCGHKAESIGLKVGPKMKCLGCHDPFTSLSYDQYALEYICFSSARNIESNPSWIWQSVMKNTRRLSSATPGFVCAFHSFQKRKQLRWWFHWWRVNQDGWDWICCIQYQYQCAELNKLLSFDWRCQYSLYEEYCCIFWEWQTEKLSVNVLFSRHGMLGSQSKVWQVLSAWCQRGCTF